MSTYTKNPVLQHGVSERNESSNSFLYKNVSTKTDIYIKDRIIGYVTGDTFYKTLYGSRHFLRKPPAIAFDISTLDDAKAAGAERVEVTDRDTKIKYTALISHIFAKGKRFNRGYGDQIYLVMSGWKKSGKGLTVQTSLFDTVGV